ncbi:MAG: hypothetical protein HYR96_08045 [Deltaproteobacteria bacterium]|nr:hypothetical protein [Deltaproteobacteria bacterium]MBI3293459.1 hypothetical protein [Deltaproteobacteria bacterium]
MKTRIITLVALISSPLLFAAGHPCQEDIQRFCPEAATLGEVAACIKKSSNLSAGCQQVVGLVKSQARPLIIACFGDFQEHCAQVEGGKGERLLCMLDHSAAFSSSCQSAIASAQFAAHQIGLTASNVKAWKVPRE